MWRRVGRSPRRGRARCCRRSSRSRSAGFRRLAVDVVGDERPVGRPQRTWPQHVMRAHHDRCARRSRCRTGLRRTPSRRPECRGGSWCRNGLRRSARSAAGHVPSGHVDTSCRMSSASAASSAIDSSEDAAEASHARERTHDQHDVVPRTPVADVDDVDGELSGQQLLEVDPLGRHGALRQRRTRPRSSPGCQGWSAPEARSASRASRVRTLAGRWSGPRGGAHDRHVPGHHVDQLRQLVDLEPAKQASPREHPGVAPPVIRATSPGGVPLASCGTCTS